MERKLHRFLEEIDPYGDTSEWDIRALFGSHRDETAKYILAVLPMIEDVKTHDLALEILEGLRWR